MFNLDLAISEWRQAMLAAGIKAPVPLEELESHLREDIERQMRSGLSAQKAFESTVQQLGQPIVLKTEFSKVGGTTYEQLKQLFCTLAGIPNYQLATNMNTPNQNIEPRWATYLKTVAFIFPAVCFWILTNVFVLPKLKDICAASGIHIPPLITFALDLSDLFKNNFFIAATAICLTLTLLEWRCNWWRRYRRLAFGIGVFLMNSAVFILITMMIVLAVGAATYALHHAK